MGRQTTHLRDTSRSIFCWSSISLRAFLATAAMRFVACGISAASFRPPCHGQARRRERTGIQ
jgi:hypothetical protein